MDRSTLGRTNQSFIWDKEVMEALPSFEPFRTWLRDLQWLFCQGFRRQRDYKLEKIPWIWEGNDHPNEVSLSTTSVSQDRYIILESRQVIWAKPRGFSDAKSGAGRGKSAAMGGRVLIHIAASSLVVQPSGLICM